MSTPLVKTTFYVKVAPIRSVKGVVVGCRVDGVTQKPPGPSTGYIAVQLTLRVPPSVFGPYVPTAVLTLPEPPADAIEVDPVTLVAQSENGALP